MRANCSESNPFNTRTAICFAPRAHLLEMTGGGAADSASLLLETTSDSSNPVIKWKDNSVGQARVAAFNFMNSANTTVGQLAYQFNGTGASQWMRTFVNGAERMRWTGVGNVKIAGTAVRGTTEGTNHLDIFDGTAPVGTLANGISLYSTSGELRVMDAAGNATLLSPHDQSNNDWIYDSVDTRTGKRLRIDMERMMRAINEKFGWDFVHDFAAGADDNKAL